MSLISDQIQIIGKLSTTCWSNSLGARRTACLCIVEDLISEDVVLFSGGELKGHPHVALSAFDPAVCLVGHSQIFSELELLSPPVI